MKDAFEVLSLCSLPCQKNELRPRKEKSHLLELWSEFPTIFFSFAIVHFNLEAL